MGAEVGSLPGLGAFSHMGGSVFGATVHAAVHDAFMTLPPYTRTSEGEVHELGLGVRNCSHRARSRPLSATSKSIERACEATSAADTPRCASRGFIKSLSTLHLNFRKSMYARRVQQPGERVVQLYGKNRNNCILLNCSEALRRAFRCGR